MPTSSHARPRRFPAWASAVLFVVPVILAASAIPSQAFASTTHCSGPVSSHSGGTTYKVIDLSVTHTTCTVGKKLSSKIPADNMPKPITVEGFRCTATVHYTHPGISVAGGSENYVCRKQTKLVTWDLEVPAED
jgi:hypothetical protein